MPRITRPGDQPQQSRAQVSEGLAATAGSGLVAMGQKMVGFARQFAASNPAAATKQLSAFLDAQGRQLFEESKPVEQASQLNGAMTDASEEFIRGKFERYKQTTDKDGNPTFSTLHTDIENIGKDVIQRHAEKITDPKTRERFAERMGRMVSSHKLTAVKDGLKMQHRDALKNLDRGLGGVLQRAMGDDLDMVGTYENEGLDMLRDARATNLISEDEFQQKARELPILLRTSVLNQGINSDRGRVEAILQQPAAQIGITEDKRAHLQATVEAANKSDAVAIKQAEEQQKVDEATEEATLTDSLAAHAEAGTLRADELMSFKDKIAPASYERIRAQAIKTVDRDLKRKRENGQVAYDISNGRDIGKYTPKRIDQYFNASVKQTHDNLGRAPTLVEESQIAGSIPTPVEAFADKLGSKVKFGELQEAEDIIASYTYLRDRKKPALSVSFDSEAEQIVNHAAHLVERGATSPKIALRQAREKFMEPNNLRTEHLRSEFKNLSQFKPNRLNTTVAKALTDGWFHGAPAVSPDAAATFKFFVASEYEKSGSAESAISYAKAQMDKTHGESALARDGEYMFMPPEKVFPSIDSTSLKSILESDVKSVIPEGVDPSTVKILADELTDDSRTWLLTYEREGQIVAIDNPETGQPRRWSPIGTKFFDEQQAKIVDDATKLRQQFIDKQTKNQDFLDAMKSGEVSTTSKVKQEVQEMTEKAPEAAQEPAVQRAVETSTKSSSHMELAESFLGSKERDPKSREVLKNFFKASIGVDLDPAKTAWCAAFANSVLKASGKETVNIKGMDRDGKAWARGFMKWGKSTKSPKKGDIVVFEQVGHSWKGHVGFFDKVNSDGTISVLGGNQKNQVKRSKYSTSKNVSKGELRILGYRTAPTASEIKSKAEEL